MKRSGLETWISGRRVYLHVPVRLGQVIVKLLELVDLLVS